MSDLVAQVAQAAGIDAETAQKAIGTVLGFLQKEGPSDAVGQLMNAIPGAEDMVAQAQGEGSGGGLLGAVGGLFGGGGLMALAGQLQGLGLGMGQMQDVGKTLFAHGRELVGEDVMGQIAGSVPGLSQFA